MARATARPLYRCRATSLILTHWTERLFGVSPPAFRLSSLLLHCLGAVLVFALGTWTAIGWKRSLPAAAFFAVAEGHQEAVVWYAAVPELLVFLFSGIAFIAFVRSVTRDRWSVLYYWVSLLGFVMALASKESGVAVLGALVLVCVIERVPFRRSVRLLAPFGLLTCVYLSAIFVSRDAILHFHDGAFSFDAPFLRTIVNSVAGILWVWGAPAIVVLFVFERKLFRGIAPACLIWICLSLLPYSFLIYLNRVPSRHTYLASVGLSLIVASGVLALSERAPKKWIMALAGVILLHNCVYLWTKKQSQYERRAEPTEQLIRAYKMSSSVVIECWPYSHWIAKYAVEIGAVKRLEDGALQLRPNCRPDETVITVELLTAAPPLHGGHGAGPTRLIP